MSYTQGNTTWATGPKTFELTAEQGRVMFHAERVFRSAGGPGVLAAGMWRDACADAALPFMVSQWTPEQCVRGLQLIEWAARQQKMHLFRNTRAQWEDIAERIGMDLDVASILAV